MNILVTGANGQLGRSIRLVSQHSEDHYIFTDVVEAEDVETTLLDMTDAKAVNHIVDAKNIDSIVNCAAYTNVDKAETDDVLCRRLNAEAPRILAEAMQRVGGLLVHISTDYVFGGDPYNTPCREDQKGTPTGVYGRTKLEGEQNIIGSGCRYVILRTAWLYSEYGKNFVKTMLNLTATKPQLKVVFDQVGTPTYAHDLAEAIAVILAKDKGQKAKGEVVSSGIYHYSNEGVCSWYDFAKTIQQIASELETPENVESFGPHASCEILPCHSSEFPSPVRRPAFSVLDKTKIKETFGVSVPYWTASLQICIRNLAIKAKG
ncbi:MAG: dTDP-4-dehydrorhamnose reductase [Bacteroidaceae bacterium]|nr:dTDP-4-dehydrorhamnose reductase [Bacteroidaceae bacterium]